MLWLLAFPCILTTKNVFLVTTCKILHVLALCLGSKNMVNDIPHRLWKPWVFCNASTSTNTPFRCVATKYAHNTPFRCVIIFHLPALLGKMSQNGSKKRAPRHRTGTLFQGVPVRTSSGAKRRDFGSIMHWHYACPMAKLTSMKALKPKYHSSPNC